MAGITLSTALAIAGTAATVGSTIIGGLGRLAVGRAEQSAANYQAAQLDDAADEEMAAAQREAYGINKEMEELSGRGRVVAAASGAGASDQSVVNLDADLRTAGAYHQQMARYGGAQRATGLRNQAEMARRSGKMSVQGARWGAAGTILGGFGSAATDFASFYHEFGAAGDPATDPNNKNVPHTGTIYKPEFY